MRSSSSLVARGAGFAVGTWVRRTVVCLGLALLAFGAAQTCEEGQRLFEHELLATDPVCIPETPERILALDMASVEMTLLTGKNLVGTANWILNELPLLEPRFAEALAEVTDVGYPADLETTLLLEPDLILAVGTSAAGDTIDASAASKIAPVVLADPAVFEDWQLAMSFWAEVLGAEELYARMIENYDARVSELRAELGDVSDMTVSLVAVAAGNVYMWMPDTAPGSILDDVGFARPASQALTGEAARERYGSAQYIQVSQERFDLLEADVIFYYTYAASDPETAEEEAGNVRALEQNPLWQSLRAVQAGNAYFVPGYWWRAQTYLLANKVLDDIFTYLAGVEADTPVLELP